MKIIELINYLTLSLGLKPQEKWDNSGLQCGNPKNEISGVVLTMDVTEQNIKMCKETGSNLIISHHPLIFTKVNSIDYCSYIGNIIKELILNDITVYSMHTSLDLADFGVNYFLSKAINIKKTDFLTTPDSNSSMEYGYGYVADIDEIKLEDYAKIVKKTLKCDMLKLYTNNPSKIIKRIAVCGGGATDFIPCAINKNVDLYITGDIKYHDAQLAVNNNLSILDAGHYNTEVVVLNGLKSFVEKKVANVNIYDINCVNYVII